jgi:nicotinamidase-related amidase
MKTLPELAAPAHTAIVTQECQGAVIGPDAGLAVLAKEARRVALPNIARLLPTARAVGVRTVHCLVQRRPMGSAPTTMPRFSPSGTAASTSLPARLEPRCCPSWALSQRIWS